LRRFFWYSWIMQLQVTKPELEQFITQKVKAGDFPSPEAVVEDALARMMEDDQTLTDEDIAAIDRAAEQFQRGEGIDFAEFAAQTRKRYGLK
jgi:Arc/MetJ-type ribon-helix-helix transcriptional regulator